MSEQLKYTVDIVMCIDATGSMKPQIERVKANALKFYPDLRDRMTAKGKVIDHLRVKVIVFRDFFADGTQAFDQSLFYSLPSAATDFSNFVQKIFADGGGDEPESGLEALAVAIKQPWNKNGDKTRQVIVIWSDTSAHKLEKGAHEGLSNYPQGLPTNFNELTELWENNQFITTDGRRLVIFAPETYPWADIVKYWEGVLLLPSIAGAGLGDIDYETIIETIASSIAF